MKLGLICFFRGFKHHKAVSSSLSLSLSDIDECTDPDVCGTNAVCINHPDGFICECHPGYSNYGNNQSKCTGERAL